MGSEVGDEEYEESPEWFARDMALVTALRGLALPAHLKNITVGVTNDQELGESPGLDDLETWLPMTEKYCEEAFIEVELAEERLYEKRMAEFLLHGRTKW